MHDAPAPRVLGWSICELKGRTKLAAFVTEEQVAGVLLLRLDVPATDHSAGMTQYIPPDSLWRLTTVAEEIARAYADECGEAAAPVQRYELRALSRPVTDDEFLGPDDAARISAALEEVNDDPPAWAEGRY